MIKLSLFGRNLRYRFEYLVVWTFISIFKKLSLDVASSLGGWLAERIGPNLRKHSIARNNIVMIFPEWSEQEVKTVLKGMWNNLGRVFGEYCHLDNIKLCGASPRIELLGREHVQRLNRDNIGGNMWIILYTKFVIISPVNIFCTYYSKNVPNVV